MTNLCYSLLLVVLTLHVAPVLHAKDLTIAFMELRKDKRYDKKHTYARYLTQALGRPYQGAEIALKEIRYHGKEAGIEFKLERIRARDIAELRQKLKAQYDKGTRFFILDAKADVVAALSEAADAMDVLLFNISARENSLRQKKCRTNLLHIIPSHAMLMDALVQYLVSKKWRKALVLEGETTGDKLLTKSLERAAKRYGVKIQQKKTFKLSNDPRHRDQNNIALLTSGSAADVVFVSDSNGEFARDVPYQTLKPQLVVGSEGLAAAAWHWAWERYGAPQLEKRFEKRHQRPMKSVDWAGWLAVKVVADAVQYTKSGDFKLIRDYLFSDKVIIDAFKGNRASFRHWSGQLRQPILLITHNWVVARAPVKGFLHRINNLDTLGFDQRDSECSLAK